MSVEQSRRRRNKSASEPPRKSSVRDSVVAQIRKVADGKPTITVIQAGELLGLTRDKTYAAVRDGSLPVLRFGERYMRVSTAVVERLLLGE
jgi:excisionase family DNA binding protein